MKRSLFFFCSIIISLPLIASDDFEKELIIIVTSYNNASWYQRNLDSIFNQDYENYRVIYVDDCSTDGTYELVKNYIITHDCAQRIQLIRNETRKGALANLYTAIISCKNHEIILTVDGDDWLKHSHVLEKINMAYSDPNVWMTYGQFMSYPHRGLGHCKAYHPSVVQLKYYRDFSWLVSQLRTFYAGLFKQIPLKDLLYNGSFYPVTWDLAIMFPLLEMVNGKYKCISDILYVYNHDNPLSDYKKNRFLQKRLDAVIRGKKQHATITDDTIIKYEPKDNYTVDIIVLGPDVENNVSALQKNIQENIVGFGSIKKMPRFSHDFAADLRTCLTSLPDEYVLFMPSNMRFTATIELHKCAQLLLATHSHGFYFALADSEQYHPHLLCTQKKPLFVEIASDICAWQFMYGQYNWRTPYTFNAALYKKNDIIAALQNITCTSEQQLIALLNQQKVDMCSTGLCFKQAKIRSY